MMLGIAAILLILLIFGPSVWAKHIFKKYAVEIDAFPGTGGELADHLIKRLELGDVHVEEGEQNENYYDPENKLVKLSPENFNGKSLTAVTVAAHEIGHAIQHKSGYKPLALRSRLARFSWAAEKVAAMMLVAFPFLTLLTRSPPVGIFTLACGLTILLLPVLVHLITLPVEWDASFKRALPVLIAGEYIPESAIPIAKRILTAAALTYLAASLASILNFYRWMVFLRR
ncbi:MAG: zinc metallopeptidase [Gammaproteobacteria bacterium]